jgi:leucine dehydrogenase
MKQTWSRNPSPITAYGVYRGLKAAVQHYYGHDHLAGLKIAVQGMGAVGYALSGLLYQDGVELTVADVRLDVLERAKVDFPGLSICGVDEIWKMPVNVLAPCALGGQINEHTIPHIKASIIAGAANNQLGVKEDGWRLMQRGILYTPDYVINSGGVMAVAYEHFLRSGFNPLGPPLNRETLFAHVERIGETLGTIFRTAAAQGVPPGEAADMKALKIMNTGTKTLFTRQSWASDAPDDGTRVLH